MSNSKRYIPLHNTSGDGPVPPETPQGPWRCTTNEGDDYRELFEAHRSERGDGVVFRVSVSRRGHYDGACNRRSLSFGAERAQSRGNRRKSSRAGNGTASPTVHPDEMTNTEIKELAPRMPTKYLRDFFAEKDIPAKTFEIEGSEWGTNFIPNEVVVEHMLQMGKDEAKAVEDILRKIDFANGDVNHFLGHLAKALAL